jgi:hypothetical protein
LPIAMPHPLRSWREAGEGKIREVKDYFDSEPDNPLKTKKPAHTISPKTSGKI